MTIRQNSVLSRHIKDGQVGARDLAANSVDTRKVKDATLQAGDFAPDQLPAGARGDQGPKGDQGPPGEQGPKGDQGPPGPQQPVTGAHVEDGALTGADIFDNALTGADIDESTLLGFAASNHNHDSTYVNEGQSNSVSAGMIANPTRSISLPIFAVASCDATPGAPIDHTNGSDSAPDFNYNAATHRASLQFDDTGGSPDENHQVCVNVSVPSDYDSGGLLRVRAATANAGASAENLFCTVSIEGTISTAGPITIDSSSLSTYTCAPTFGAQVFAGRSLLYEFEIDTPGAAMDDPVDIAGLEFVYTATQ